MKEAVKMVVTHFFVITVAVLFFTTLANTINGVEEYPISFIWQVFLTGVLGALPSFVFCSKKELTKKQWQLRYVCHFLFIELIILAEGRLFDWYDSLLGGLIIAIYVILVYAVVYIYSYFVEMKDAKNVNNALQAFNNEREEDITN